MIASRVFCRVTQERCLRPIADDATTTISTTILTTAALDEHNLFRRYLTGVHKLMHPEGECATARACDETGENKEMPDPRPHDHLALAYFVKPTPPLEIRMCRAKPRASRVILSFALDDQYCKKPLEMHVRFDENLHRARQPSHTAVVCLLCSFSLRRHPHGGLPARHRLPGECCSRCPAVRALVPAVHSQGPGLDGRLVAEVGVWPEKTDRWGLVQPR